MPGPDLRQKFRAALDALVNDIKRDPTILATILCGSLSHDTVWQRSDIDLVLVAVDDKNTATTSLSLVTDDINVHAWLLPRTQFRKIVEGSTRNSFIHALLVKGKLLYAHDSTIEDLFASLTRIGERDTEWQLLRAMTQALPAIDKAHKWWITRRDVHYTALWILYVADALARVEIISRHLVADREVLPQAMALNPAFFTVVYTDLLSAAQTPAKVEAALASIDAYVSERAAALFAPILGYLDEAREVRGASEIDAHFARTADVSGASLACEYLAHQGLIGKASVPIRLTKKSHVDVQEQAFYSLTRQPLDGQDDW